MTDYQFCDRCGDKVYPGQYCDCLNRDMQAKIRYEIEYLKQENKNGNKN